MSLGAVFGRLTVFSGPFKIRDRGGRNRSKWICRCKCGSEVGVDHWQLLKGTRSCGCLQREAAAVLGRSIKKHGESVHGGQSPEYRIWHGMIQRCHNKNDQAYPGYGGRGITVCEEWRSSYVAFLAYIGRRPSPSHSIDRIDNNAGYHPGNVRWATKQEQARNTRYTVFLTLNGATRSLVEWSEVTGLPYSALHNRLRDKWPVERVLTAPLRQVTKCRNT